MPAAPPPRHHAPGPPAQPLPPILRLPVEVQLDIIACLPLAERLVWARETCAQLRRLSGMLGRQLLCPPQTVRARSGATVARARLSLPALYAAAQTVHRTPALLASAAAPHPPTPPGDHDDPHYSSDESLPTPPPESVQNAWYVLSPKRQQERAAAHAAAAAQAAASRLRRAVDHHNLGCGPGSDACLFLRAVRMLLAPAFPWRTDLAAAQTGRSDAGLPTSLYLVGWHGIPGDLLREMLIHEPTLRNVATIVKTDQHDSLDVWSSFPSAFAVVHRTHPPLGSDRYSHFAQRLCSSQREYYDDAYNLSLPSMGQPTPSTRPSPHPGGQPRNERIACRHAQATVAIGSRDPPFFVKGAGLSAGYDCICFNSPSPSSSPSPSPSGSRSESPLSADDQQLPRPGLKHIILQGRYRLREAEELETMFDWSDTTCTGCRQPIFV